MPPGKSLLMPKETLSVSEKCLSPEEKYKIQIRTYCLYSFTLPAEILLIMYFEQKQNTLRIGMTEIATAK